MMPLLKHGIAPPSLDLQSFFGSAAQVRIDISLTGTEGRRFKSSTLEDGSQQRLYIFSSGEEVAGT